MKIKPTPKKSTSNRSKTPANNRNHSNKSLKNFIHRTSAKQPTTATAIIYNLCLLKNTLCMIMISLENYIS